MQPAKSLTGAGAGKSFGATGAAPDKLWPPKPPKLRQTIYPGASLCPMLSRESLAGGLPQALFSLRGQRGPPPQTAATAAAAAGPPIWRGGGVTPSAERAWALCGVWRAAPSWPAPSRCPRPAAAFVLLAVT